MCKRKTESGAVVCAHQEIVLRGIVWGRIAKQSLYIHALSVHADSALERRTL